MASAEETMRDAVDVCRSEEITVIRRILAWYDAEFPVISNAIFRFIASDEQDNELYAHIISLLASLRETLWHIHCRLGTLAAESGIILSAMRLPLVMHVRDSMKLTLQLEALDRSYEFLARQMERVEQIITQQRKEREK